MAGKFCLFDDSPDANVSASDYSFSPRTSRAFCDGRAVQIAGGLIVDNPFAVTTERENYYAWRAGWTNANGGALASTTCCAI